MIRRLALLAMLVPLVAATEPAAQLDAVRITNPPKIDGRFDDPVWKDVPVTTGFRVQRPVDGAEPSERTEFRVAYDDKNLYVAVRNHDRDPSRISKRLTRRDRDIETDWLCLFIDSRNDNNTAWFFQLSAAGVKVDGQNYNDTETSYDWDGVWDGAVAIDDGGWNAEFAIPFTALRFSPSDVNHFGFQVMRNVSRRKEVSLWSWRPRETQGFVSLFGELDGLTKIVPRRVFELRPYLLVKAAASTPEGGGFFGQTGENVDADLDADFEAGLDLKLGLTSELALDATFNPDFGQVEADQVVLNLTRFETFFPEKRPFFVEGRELFETPLQLVYGRRIGRPPTGLGAGATLGGDQVIDSNGSLRIWGASKITGNLGPKLNVAALAAVTAAEKVVVRNEAGEVRDLTVSPERLYAVLRARLAPAAGTFIGLTATAVTRLGGDIALARLNHDAYTQALDAWWQLGGRWRVTAQVALSERVGGAAAQDADGAPCEGGPDCRPIVRGDGTSLEPGDVGWGGTVRAEYSSKHLLGRASWRTLSPRFDVNDIGFIPRWAEHSFIAIAGYREPDPKGIFQNYAIVPYVEGTMTYEGKPTYVRTALELDAELDGFVFTSPTLGIVLPGTYDPLETLDGSYFENKPAFDGNWFVNTNSGKAVSGYARFQYRHDLGGRGSRVGFEGGLNVQAASNLELSLEPSFAIEKNQLRFFDCATASGDACVFVDGARDYRFADLDSRFFSLTFRGTYTLTTNFSIQGYAQLFLAEGTFDRFRTISTMGARPTIDREDLAFSDEMTSDGDFETAALNLNLVARWEPRRGSSLFLVYTRAQESPFSTLSRLGRGSTIDVLLLKFVYFLG